MPLFDLETNEKILNTFLSLARMEEEVKRYVLKEEVSRSNIRRLAALSVEDRKAALVLLTCLKTWGKQPEGDSDPSRRDCQEGSMRRKRDHRICLKFRPLSSHPELTSTQKTERVKKVLMDLRYPRMSQLEEQFEKKRRDLNLPSEISLHHPPFFEGKGLENRISIPVDGRIPVHPVLALCPG